MFSPAAAAAPKSCKCLEEVEAVDLLPRGAQGPERGAAAPAQAGGMGALS